MKQKSIDRKICDLITFIILVIGVGFGFQILFLTKMTEFPYVLVSIIIPITFTKFWWNGKKESDKDMGYN